MSKNIIPLKKFLHNRLRETIHGNEFDMVTDKIDIEMMMGVEYGEGILSVSHELWDTYPEPIETHDDIERAISMVVRTLKADGTITTTFPYGEEAEIIYCEVEKPETNDDSISVECASCDAYASAETVYVPEGNTYKLKLTVSCSFCGHNGSYQRTLIKE